MAKVEPKAKHGISFKQSLVERLDAEHENRSQGVCQSVELRFEIQDVIEDRDKWEDKTHEKRVEFIIELLENALDDVRD